MRAIGAGFHSALFADIRSVEDARIAVDAVPRDHDSARPRPHGHGNAPRRRHGAPWRHARLRRRPERRRHRHHGREEAEMRKLLRTKPKKVAAKQAPAVVRTKGKAIGKSNGRASARGNYA
jgi:hypothetical protein